MARTAVPQFDLYGYDAEKRQQFPLLCGVDEAGRGPLAGDVYAAAVILSPEHLPEGLNDSKKLSEKKRELLFPQIQEQAIAYCIATASVAEKIDIKSLANLAERIFSERENARILPEESVTMQSLLTVGTSAGGRQPKAIVAINRKNGEVRSGQIAGLEEFDYYLVKFGNSQCSSAELEMSYYELATMAGINMMPSKLYQVDGNNHFMTKRFDRNHGKKIHTQTLAAISPDADSYEQLITVCRKLHLPEADCYEVFRRMVFNILANNTEKYPCIYIWGG